MVDQEKLLAPNRSVEWLGMVWNAEDLTLKIADRRISKLKTFISELLSKGASSICQLSSFVGQVILLSPVVGNITRLRSRYCQMAIAAAGSYDSWPEAIYYLRQKKKQNTM